MGPSEQLRDGGRGVWETLSDPIVGLSGHTIRTMAGMPSGSTSSTLTWSWLIWADAQGVLEDWGMGSHS